MVTTDFNNFHDIFNRLLIGKCAGIVQFSSVNVIYFGKNIR